MKTEKQVDISRRSFLKGGGMAAGGLLATAALPALADDPSVFPNRGGWERLSLQFFEIKAGATKPFTVLHISDSHLTAAYDDEPEKIRQFAKKRTTTFGGRQEEALRDSIAWAKVHCDCLVHTGDMVDLASRANLDLVKKYFGEGGDMMLGCLGNHEYYYCQGREPEPEEKKNAIRAALKDAFPFELSLSSSVRNGVNFVMLDNSTGMITADQATQFEAEVKKGLPIIIGMHCPFMLRNMVQAARRFWRKDDYKYIHDMSGFKENYKDKTTEDFVAYLRAQPLLKGILCGHGHIGAVDRFSTTALEYEVPANFFFHAQEFTIT